MNCEDYILVFYPPWTNLSVLYVFAVGAFLEDRWYETAKPERERERAWSEKLSVKEWLQQEKERKRGCEERLREIARKKKGRKKRIRKE